MGLILAVVAAVVLLLGLLLSFTDLELLWPGREAATPAKRPPRG